jgi:hypothetical protein
VIVAAFDAAVSTICLAPLGAAEFLLGDGATGEPAGEASGEAARAMINTMGRDRGTRQHLLVGDPAPAAARITRSSVTTTSIRTSWESAGTRSRICSSKARPTLRVPGAAAAKARS